MRNKEAIKIVKDEVNKFNVNEFKNVNLLIECIELYEYTRFEDLENTNVLGDDMKKIVINMMHLIDSQLDIAEQGLIVRKELGNNDFNIAELINVHPTTYKAVDEYPLLFKQLASLNTK